MKNSSDPKQITDAVLQVMDRCHTFLQIIPLVDEEEDPAKIDLSWINGEFYLARGLGKTVRRVLQTERRGATLGRWNQVLKMDLDAAKGQFKTVLPDLIQVRLPEILNDIRTASDRR